MTIRFLELLLKPSQYAIRKNGKLITSRVKNRRANGGLADTYSICYSETVQWNVLAGGVELTYFLSNTETFN